MEFEVHEHRDHVLQILDGTTVYEVGGALKNGRNTRPGEWLAPAADGTTPSRSRRANADHSTGNAA